MRSYLCYETDTNSAYIELFNITKTQYESIVKFFQDNDIDCNNIQCTTSTICKDTKEVIEKNDSSKNILEEKTKEINLNLLTNDITEKDDEIIEIKKEKTNLNIANAKVIKGYTYGISIPKKPVIFGKAKKEE